MGRLRLPFETRSTCGWTSTRQIKLGTRSVMKNNIPQLPMWILHFFIAMCDKSLGGKDSISLSAILFLCQLSFSRRFIKNTAMSDTSTLWERWESISTGGIVVRACVGRQTNKVMTKNFSSDSKCIQDNNNNNNSCNSVYPALFMLIWFTMTVSQLLWCFCEIYCAGGCFEQLSLMLCNWLLDTAR